MYVDDDTSTDTTDTTTDDTAGHDEMTVEVDGEEYDVVENYDMDGDGANDTAVVETEDGYVGYEDSDGDGTADVAVEYDEDGNPVAAAEYEESTGEWAATDVEDLEAPVGGDGTDDGSGAASDDSTDSTGSTDSADDSTQTSGSGDGMVVDLPGEDVDAGPATYDTDGDGTNDTAVVTDSDGTTYAFTDTDGDGDADQAVVIESDGDVTVAEDSGDGEWTTTETGHIDEQGNYESDSTSSSAMSASSDSAWQ